MRGTGIAKKWGHRKEKEHTHIHTYIHTCAREEYLNGMSACPELFHAKRLENYVHCTFIFIFSCSFFLRYFCTRYHRICIIFNMIYLTITSTTSPGTEWN